MGGEMNRGLEDQTTIQEVAPEEAAAGKITAEEPVGTIEDFTTELEASYQTLDKRKIELAEEESGADTRWAQSQQTMGNRAVVKAKISEAVKDGVVTILEEACASIPVSQLSTEYVEKLEDWQEKYVECIIITVDPEKKRPVLSGREVEQEKKEVEKKACMEQFKAGGVVEGTVDGIKPYGAFAKLADGVDGLLHTSQIGMQGIKHLGAVLTKGQTAEVKILSMENGKLSLSMRVPSEQTAECKEHETLNYEETRSASTELGDLLKGLKL